MPSHEILGLIAGNGKFPLLFARKARSKGYKLITIAIKGDTSFLLRFFVDKIYWVGAGDLKMLFEILKKENVKKVIMAGQVNPDNLFDKNVKIDEEFQKLFQAMKNHKADTIFAAVADRLKSEGMELIDSTFLISEYLAPRGTLTRRGPTERELADIDFGRRLAKQMGAIDVGQTVVVKEKAILAIEAMEGTDRAILRGGQIARGGAVVVKTSKPQQDNRFDIPVIGPRTIHHMISCRASCLAVESGKTLLIDREKTVRLANRAKICLVSF